jgi:hypothetical protein
MFNPFPNSGGRKRSNRWILYEGDASQNAKRHGHIIARFLSGDLDI